MPWRNPVKNLRAANGKMVRVDVTLSVQPSLGPNKAINDVIAFFKRQSVQDVLDYGAGAFRHTFPLLDAGFEVCAVEFDRQFQRAGSVCATRKIDAAKRPNFRLLLPGELAASDHDFDAAMFCYVAQGMPKATERARVLRILYRKLRDHRPGGAKPFGSFLVWMTRYDNITIPGSKKVEDGMFKPQRKEDGKQLYSFYREFRNDEIKKMLDSVVRSAGFHRVKSLGQGGRDQIFVYSKHPGVSWT